MKQLVFLFIVSISSYLFVSCDKVEPPYLKPNDNADTTACPAPDFPAFSNPQQKVLLEEFTGHKCPNCPAGSATAQALLSTYAGQMYMVGIHAGYFATPDNQGSFTANYIVPEGEEIASGYSVIFNPIGMVNRKPYNSALLVNPGDWDAAVQALLNQQPAAHIQIISETSATNASEFCIHSKVTFLQNIQGNYNLCVYVIEDSLMSPQKTNDAANYPTGVINDYKHNHVLRKVLGGTWGKNIASGSVATDSAQVHTFKLAPSLEWNLSRCEVISFVYNTDTDEIIQVAKAHLVE